MAKIEYCVCDRCGAVCKSDSKKYFTYNSIEYDGVNLIPHEFKSILTNKQLDLCENCLTSFKNWLCKDEGDK